MFLAACCTTFWYHPMQPTSKVHCLHTLGSPLQATDSKCSAIFHSWMVEILYRTLMHFTIHIYHHLSTMCSVIEKRDFFAGSLLKTCTWTLTRAPAAKARSPRGNQFLAGLQSSPRARLASLPRASLPRRKRFPRNVESPAQFQLTVRRLLLPPKAVSAERAMATRRPEHPLGFDQRLGL